MRPTGLVGCVAWGCVAQQGAPVGPDPARSARLTASSYQVFDPDLADTAWGVEASDPARLGGAVADAGDVNGDGYRDLLVAGSRWSSPLPSEAGAVLLFLGSPTGPGGTAARILEGAVSYGHFGQAAAGVGDVNGDGFDDVAVGEPGYGSFDGRVLLYAGTAAGLAAAPAWTWTPGAGGSVGRRLAGGDVDGDGYADLVVGSGAADEVAVFHGGPAGPSLVPDVDLLGSQPGSSFGVGLAVLDADGDGYDDIAVGAPTWTGSGANQGRVELFLGSSTGISTVRAWTRDGLARGDTFGGALARVADTDGDGRDELLIGSPDAENQAGRVALYRGTATGLASAPSFRTSGRTNGDLLGYALASGDVDGDGRPDLVVGAPDHLEGGAAVFLGHPSGFRSSPDRWLLEPGYTGYASLGTSVATVDLDGDGLEEVVAGAPSRWDGAAFLWTWADADGDGVDDGADLCPDTADPDQLDTDQDGVGNACDGFTLSVRGPVSAGLVESVTLEGLAPGELAQVLAAPGTGGVGPCPPTLGGTCLALGPSALPLGDATADADGVAVLALQVPWSLPTGGTFALQAAVARGVGGAESAVSDPLVLGPDDLDWDADGLDDATEALLGSDPTVDDSDGDGVPDGAETAPFLDPTSDDADGDGVLDGADACLPGDDAVDNDLDGLADACDDCPSDADPAQDDADGDHQGNPCDGPATVAAGSVEGFPGVAAIGSDAFRAGDVDADGYDDLVVRVFAASHPEANEGQLLLYRGGPAGLAPTPSWAGEPNVANARFGDSVAAGDVNGDGYGDLLVGAYRYANPQAEEGGAFLYLGSAAGPSAAWAWRWEADQAYARAGQQVALADLDGDGLDDVVVDAFGLGSDEGAVEVFYGRPGALPHATADLVIRGAAPSTFLGRVTVSPGDVNGDGYDDLLVGGSGTTTWYAGGPAGPEATTWPVPPRPLTGVIAAVGDVNGDALADVAVGDSGQNRIDVYLGARVGFSSTPSSSIAGSALDRIGGAVSAAGDVDGDGFGDVVLPISGQRTAWILLGGPTGTASEPAQELTGSAQAGDQFAASARGAGDLDGDGFADVAVGAPGYLPVGGGGGAVFVWAGVAR